MVGTSWKGEGLLVLQGFSHTVVASHYNWDSVCGSSLIFKNPIVIETRYWMMRKGVNILRANAAQLSCHVEDTCTFGGFISWTGTKQHGFHGPWSFALCVTPHCMRLITLYVGSRGKNVVVFSFLYCQMSLQYLFLFRTYNKLPLLLLWCTNVRQNNTKICI